MIIKKNKNMFSKKFSESKKINMSDQELDILKNIFDN